MHRNRLISTFTLLLAFNTLAATNAQARQQKHHPRHHTVHTPPQYSNDGKHAIIAIEATTGRVLAESNAEKALYPASTTKIMTSYLLFEALENGTLTLDQTVPVSRLAASQSPTNLGMMERVRVSTGNGKGPATYELRQTVTEIKLEDALRGMLCHSANDAAVVVAEALAGSVDNFAARMNATAQKLGMTHTHFINPNGLPGAGQHTTVEDMAKLANAVMRDFPQYYKYFDTETFTFRGTTYHNTNHLLGKYPGMDGLKTGFIGASGFNLVASARHGQHRVIGVVFGAPSPAVRNAEMERLLDRGFSRLTGGKITADARSLTLPEMPDDDTPPAMASNGTLDDTPATTNAPARDTAFAAFSLTQKTSFFPKDWHWPALKNPFNDAGQYNDGPGGAPQKAGRNLPQFPFTLKQSPLPGRDKQPAPREYMILPNRPDVRRKTPGGNTLH